MKILNFILFAAFLQFSNAYPSIKPVFPSHSLIINGEEAQLGEIPHQLMMETEGPKGFNFSCGAVLINKLQAFTAAHCVHGRTVKEVRLFAGVHDRRKKSESQMIFIRKIAIADEWNGNFKYPKADFAILTFTAPVTFNKNVQPIEWNDDHNDTFVGEKCVISGWGKTEKGVQSETLQKAETYVISNEDCQKKTSLDIIYEGHVCVYKKNIGICSGDSGGPLTCQKDGKPILVGVASWAINGCNTDYPSGFERTSYFKQFISENLIEDETNDM